MIRVSPLYDNADRTKLVSILISMENEKDLADVSRGMVSGCSSWGERPAALSDLLSILWRAQEPKSGFPPIV